MKIALVFGANSFEHEISIVSAIALKKVLKSELIYIFCDYNRDFYLIPTDKINSKRFSSGEYKKDKKVAIGQGGFYQKGLLSEKKIDCDIVMSVVHGKDGEDGSLASLFDFFKIPYIGPRVEASVISYNKLLTKLYAKEFDVKTLPYTTLQKDSNRDITLEYPVIVKPTRLGSSIGISIPTNKEELDYALDVAFEFDSQVIIEPFIRDIKEYNLAGCKCDDYRFSIIEEPEKNQILDFDKKYLDFSRTKRVNEANLSDALIAKIQENFKRLYEPFFSGALIRCDFFVIDDDVYINEINPIPGSMANYLFDDFDSIIKDLAHHLPQSIKIPQNYTYINDIQAAKGK
ncbi:D-alanine--D-alanine ligase [Sulfurospirillum sp. 1612]|uniref:D-alanine--D-alanine ligase n=1 Tax=Sulfurospirillum sp. 1612 TaxID=3094835 RepID=UPI002F93FB6F